MPRSELIISTKIIYIIYDIIYIYISKNTCTHFYFICNTLMTAGMTSQLTSLSTGFLPWSRLKPPHNAIGFTKKRMLKVCPGSCNHLMQRVELITKPAGFLDKLDVFGAMNLL